MKKQSMFSYTLIFAAGLITFTGCTTMRASSGKPLDRKETEQALETIAEAVSGREYSQEDVQALKKQLQTDPEAQSAIRQISNVLEGKQRLKYSPATGKRYAPHLEIDPETGVKLEWVE